MFWNHPKQSDTYERPERDLRDLSGVLTNVHYDESNPDGAGIYGDATVFDPFSETLGEIAPYIGVSIRAGGRVHEGEAEGRAGLLVDEINLVQSVDFVTRAGAGGKVLAQFAEAARSPYEKNKQEVKKGVSMELEEALREIGAKDTEIGTLNKSLTESKNAVDALIRENARLQESALISECAAIVAGELKECELPDITKERIQGEASKFLETAEVDEADPSDTTKFRKKKIVDADKTKSSVQEAIKVEADYISKLSGGVQIMGMGSEGAGSDGNQMEEAIGLTAAFQTLGLYESAAKIAANGR